MAKSYAELEGKLGATKVEKTAETKTETPALESARIDPPPKAPEGLDVGALNAELASNQGNLTEATRKSLHGKGFSNQTIDTYLAGLKALATQQTAALAEAVGGAESLKSTLEWAGANLSEGEQKAYNDALNSGNTDLAKMLLRGIHATRLAKVGSEPNLAGGGVAGGAAGVKPYASTAELTRDMGSQKYAEDPAFRKAVAARLALGIK